MESLVHWGMRVTDLRARGTPCGESLVHGRVRVTDLRGAGGQHWLHSFCPQRRGITPSGPPDQEQWFFCAATFRNLGAERIWLPCVQEEQLWRGTRRFPTWLLFRHWGSRKGKERKGEKAGEKASLLKATARVKGSLAAAQVLTHRHYFRGWGRGSSVNSYRKNNWHLYQRSTSDTAAQEAHSPGLAQSDIPGE